MCCNLVVFDTNLDTFRFAHLSVREFLEKQPDYVSSAINARAAETCLLSLINAAETPVAKSYLDQKAYSRIEISLLQNRLGKYIEIYWAAHCQLAGNRRVGSVLEDLLSFFLEGSNPALALNYWIGQIRKHSEGYGRLWRMQKKLSKAINSPNRPLSIACTFNFFEIVQKFTTEEITDADSKADENCTATYIAVTCGNLEVAELLVKKKAAIFTTAVIEAAAGNKYNGEEVMRLLLQERGQEISITEAVVKAAAGDSRDDGQRVTHKWLYYLCL